MSHDGDLRVLYVGDIVRPHLGTSIPCLRDGLHPTTWIAGQGRVTRVHPEVRVRTLTDNRDLWLVDGHHTTPLLARAATPAAA